jgi:PAS domain S-box-containing protein
VGVYIFDNDFRITQCNERMVKIIGSSFDKIIGLNLLELVDQTFTQLIKKALMGEIVSHDNWYQATTSSARLWLSVSVSPLMDASGNVLGGMCVVEDKTENKRIEEELARSQKLESVGVLACGIAHDFNNLLTAILGNISLAALNIKNEDKAINILNSAEEACIRAKDLTNQLLTFSKGGTPIKVLSSIGSIVKESVSFALTGSNVKCKFSIQKNIFPVEVDKGQISQVIQNIIINADHAMPKGGIIKLTAENFTAEHKHYDLLKKGNYIKITIEDKGIGIPKELINKIFDPFFTTKQKGSGLGLATSYSIIKNHGGDITVDSDLGKGTIINIYLPASEKIMSSNEQDAEYIVRGKGRILIMDDDIAVSILLEKLLIQLGYDIELASEGSQAVEIYKKAIKSGQIFDVVILDLTVPGGMGGKETMEILLEVDPDIKAIVTSGYSRDPVMSDYKKYGFKSYVAKPFNVGTLSKILDGVINDQDV